MECNKRVTLSFPAMTQLSHSSRSVRTHREGEDEDGGTGMYASSPWDCECHLIRKESISEIRKDFELT